MSRATCEYVTYIWNEQAGLSSWKLLLYKVVPSSRPPLLAAVSTSFLPPALPLPSLQVVPAGTGSPPSAFIINSGLSWAFQGEMMQLLSHTTSEASGSGKGE